MEWNRQLTLSFDVQGIPASLLYNSELYWWKSECKSPALDEYLEAVLEGVHSSEGSDSADWLVSCLANSVEHLPESQEVKADNGGYDFCEGQDEGEQDSEMWDNDEWDQNDDPYENDDNMESATQTAF